MRVEIGYTLSSEERQPEELMRLAKLAEDIGFTYALMSDHYHPWTDKQGSSPFVWAVLGGIAASTRRLRVGTGVTCPIMRIHPAIIAQASATVGCLMPGRFFLGVGSGESLNEHIVGQGWPPPDMRQDMLEEAVDILRTLHGGGEQSHYGKFFQVHDARVYNLPSQRVPVYVAAAGEQAAKLAARIGDGLICSSPVKETVDAFNAAGGAGKPRYAQMTVCWAKTEEDGVRIAHEYWPNAALKGKFKNELPRTAYLEEAAEMVTPEMIKKEVVCGPDPKRHLEELSKYVEAGFDHVYIHQVGPDQEGFMRFCEREILPNAESLAA
ncbi:MAG TPA: TIGR03557 family F420-dependent LLM class oxidoreductase [Candidatus Dormibacteraeota bacterium]|nr:TIGR03557 family F420-dependent LLM class oxidoreductase [Candidatus Dormibacteraeota bacterium]